MNLHDRYHCIAGPFNSNEAHLLAALRDYLTRTGARTVCHPEPGGQSIYRLRSECETMEETAARLERQRRIHNPSPRKI